MTDVTRILNSIEKGDAEAINALLPAVYEELRQMADRQLAHEGPGHTLQATALVHEAYLRLVGSDGNAWSSGTYFFGAASEAMRRILVEHARKKGSKKRGGGQKRVDFMSADVMADESPDDLIALDEALTKFSQIDPIKAELVKLRFFAGLSFEQAAGLLDISPATARRHWNYARAWLYGRVCCTD
ncbi:MAG: sigma-70 family RNA polymerase sigma factor [Planctomycetes bacterium]|jgi:RNA polymerase sigma factor (TIGR02999 family)|nr:sigma-70 family RNA polymerase sigma factor [Planctomycetota bacterium]